MPNQTGISGSKKRGLLAVGAAVILLAGILIVRGAFFAKGPSDYIDEAMGDVKITTDTLSEKATFYALQAGGEDMELIALKTADGQIRTAFNTCQVCYASGRGYYKQEGTSLVCQNCGNRFSADQVGILSGGCNPVPITDDYRETSDGVVTIPASFLEEASIIFQNWKV